MDAKQQLSVYVDAYKHAAEPAAPAPAAKKDLTEKALAILRKTGKGAMRGLGKGLEKAGKSLQGKEAVCPKCGNVASKCACGKKC
jgi:hypothetical protein